GKAADLAGESPANKGGARDGRIAKSIVEAHGGRVWAESQLDSPACGMTHGQNSDSVKLSFDVSYFMLQFS
ncbi:hypothetical protein WDW37_18500, partial [Bdellovibrionota bacterium FG-1]